MSPRSRYIILAIRGSICDGYIKMFGCFLHRQSNIYSIDQLKKHQNYFKVFFVIFLHSHLIVYQRDSALDRLVVGIDLFRLLVIKQRKFGLVFFIKTI